MATCSITRSVKITEDDAKKILNTKPTALFYDMLNSAKKREKQRKDK